MLHGLDTGFLVAAEVAEHAEYSPARQTLARLVAAGDRIAIVPQVLAEFVHVVTDPRRFAQPLRVLPHRPGTPVGLPSKIESASVWASASIDKSAC